MILILLYIYIYYNNKTGAYMMQQNTDKRQLLTLTTLYNLSMCWRYRGLIENNNNASSQKGEKIIYSSHRNSNCMA